MDILDWKDFNVAMVGATAALAGLVIVAGSVNIERIIKFRSLTGRLGVAIGTLVLALGVSGAGLAPAESLSATGYGWAIVIATLIVTFFQIHTTRIIVSDPEFDVGSKLSKSGLGFIPLIAYIVGGVLIIIGSPVGLTVVAAACLLAVIVALLVSWIVLVEVLR